MSAAKRLGAALHSSLLSDDQLPALKERVGNTYCLDQKTAAIAAQIQDKGVHAF